MYDRIADESYTPIPIPFNRRDAAVEFMSDRYMAVVRGVYTRLSSTDHIAQRAILRREARKLLKSYSGPRPSKKKTRNRNFHNFTALVIFCEDAVREVMDPIGLFEVAEELQKDIYKPSKSWADNFEAQARAEMEAATAKWGDL